MGSRALTLAAPTAPRKSRRLIGRLRFPSLELVHRVQRVMAYQLHALQSLRGDTDRRRGQHDALQPGGIGGAELSEPAAALETYVRQRAHVPLLPLVELSEAPGRFHFFHGCAVAVSARGHGGPQLLDTEQAVEESLAPQQRRRIDPRFAPRPALDVGRREQNLAELAGDEYERKHVTRL